MDETEKIKARKKAAVGLRQARRLLEMPARERIQLIAKGLPIILKSAQGFVAGAEALKDNPREAELLAILADEEAAKALILIDAVKCPDSDRESLSRTIKNFYSHSARLIYARASAWHAADMQQLREYLDSERRTHYVDGPTTGGEFIYPNRDLFARGSLMYADLLHDGDGNLTWNLPRGSLVESFGFLGDISPVENIAAALNEIGLFTPAGLQIIAEVWHEWDNDCGTHQLNRQLIQRTLERLNESKLISEKLSDRAILTAYQGWQMPMYSLDLSPLNVTMEDLEAERKAYEEAFWRSEFGDEY